VASDPIQTPGSAGSTVEITWKLTTPGWLFQKNKGIDNIKIKKPHPNHKQEWKVTDKSDQEYKARNIKEGGPEYKYEINLTNGTTPLSWDPTIMN
jgi:hypothetical protein